MPAIARAASSRIVRLMRFRPEILDHGVEHQDVFVAHVVPNLAWSASVLTINLGTPSGKARMAAEPMVVPADPPSAQNSRDPSGRA